MTKVSYTISNGTTTFKTSSYHDALAWKDKGWKVETTFEKFGDVYSSEDLAKALS